MPQKIFGFFLFMSTGISMSLLTCFNEFSILSSHDQFTDLIRHYHKHSHLITMDISHEISVNLSLRCGWEHPFTLAVNGQMRVQLVIQVYIVENHVHEQFRFIFESFTETIMIPSKYFPCNIVDIPHNPCGTCILKLQ